MTVDWVMKFQAFYVFWHSLVTGVFAQNLYVLDYSGFRLFYLSTWNFDYFINNFKYYFIFYELMFTNYYPVHFNVKWTLLKVNANFILYNFLSSNFQLNWNSSPSHHQFQFNTFTLKLVIFIVNLIQYKNILHSLI